MTEGRLNFSDYKAYEQEKDARRAERTVLTDVYIMQVDSVWNAYIPRKRNDIIINGNKGEDIKTFISNLKEDFRKTTIKPRFRCIENMGVAEHIRKHLRELEYGRFRQYNNKYQR